MKVNISTGAISIEDKTTTIHPSLTRGEFIASTPGARPLLSNGEYTTCQFAAASGEDRYVINLNFKGEFLNSVQIAKIIGSQGPDRWTSESELRRKVEHDRILLETLGSPPYSFPWGEISSIFDAKSASINISVQYRTKS